MLAEKKETPDVFDREAGLRSTSCYPSPVFTSLDVVLFSYLSVSSFRCSVFLIVSRRVCAGFGRRLQTVVLFVCLLSGAETYPPQPPSPTPKHPSANHPICLCHLREATLSQNTVKSAKCSAPGVNANQILNPGCAAYVISAVSLNHRPLSVVHCRFLFFNHSSERCANTAARHVNSSRSWSPILSFAISPFPVIVLHECT